MGYPLQINQAAQPLLFLLVLSSDHITGATGKTPTVTLSKNGAAFGAPAGAVTEIASGWYKVAGNATDSATLGPLALHVTEASSDPVDDVFQVVAYNPQLAYPDAAHFTNGRGDLLGNLDATISSRLASGSYTAPDNTDIVTALGDLVTLLARVDPAAAITALASAVAALPNAAAVLTAFKADTEWKTILAGVNGVFAYDATTHVLTLKDKANAVLLGTLTLTLDGNGIITARASA